MFQPKISTEFWNYFDFNTEFGSAYLTSINYFNQLLCRRNFFNRSVAPLFEFKVLVFVIPGSRYRISKHNPGLLRFLFLFLFTLVCREGLSQSAVTDSSGKVQQDTSKIRKWVPDPKRATLLSVVFPGAGQIYNKKYWKLPILYGGAAALGYFINLNHQEYLKTRDSYLQVKAGQPDIYRGAYSAEQLAQLREYWRRNRDLLIIVSGFVYLLNVADAAVDAHLSSFDVSDDLSLRWQPDLYRLGNQPVFGLKLALAFQKNSKPMIP